MIKPRVSICLPVFNGIRFLPRAMDSIRQQSFTSWECIVVDDGSTDGSSEYLKVLRDPRIHLIQRQKNGGLASSLNEAMRHSRGEYLARMDQDDCCLPGRLRVQVDHLDRHSSHQVVGGQIRRNSEKETWRYPLDSRAITSRCAFGAPFAHPTVMFRRGTFSYRSEYDYAEDWDLWDRLAQSGASWANLREVVLVYGENPDGMSRQGKDRQKLARGLVSHNILTRLGLPANSRNIACHLALTQPEPGVPHCSCLGLLAAIFSANQKRAIYPRVPFVFECFRWALAIGKRRGVSGESQGLEAGGGYFAKRASSP